MEKLKNFNKSVKQTERRNHIKVFFSAISFHIINTFQRICSKFSISLWLTRQIHKTEHTPSQSIKAPAAVSCLSHLFIFQFPQCYPALPSFPATESHHVEAADSRCRQEWKVCMCVGSSVFSDALRRKHDRYFQSFFFFKWED